ncbi:MAG TPA: ABC transporter ATP-binding protein [Candidatus Limnocylindrales bacterium]
MTEILRCEGLVRRFGALAAVDGVDLSVPAGARHALIGPNGAGKSTLFRLISGGLRVTAGTVSFDGNDITGLPERRRAQLGIGQTFQHTSVFGSLTAAQNVALAARRHLGTPWWPLPRRVAWADRVLKVLEEVGLPDHAGVTANSLSHGQCRQLEVAIALAAQPRLLLLDEPGAGMSAAESGLLLRLLQALPAEVTVVFVEHDLDLVFKLASRVTVMHLGKVLMSGTPQEVQASHLVQEAYLGTGKREDLFDVAPSA